MNNAFSKKSIFTNSLNNQEDFSLLAEEYNSFLFSVSIYKYSSLERSVKVVTNVFSGNMEDHQQMKNTQNLKPYMIRFLKNPFTSHFHNNPIYLSIDSFKEFSNTKNSTSTVEFKDTALEKIKYQLDYCLAGNIEFINKKNIHTN